MEVDSSFVDELQEIKRILWGEQVSEELFHRWSQGKRKCSRWFSMSCWMIR
jgi:hypothetical protein